VKLDPLILRAVNIILSPWRAFKFFCFFVGLVFSIILLGVSFYIYSFYSSCPNFEKRGFDYLKKVAIVSVKKRLENKTNKQYWVPLKKINRDLVYAVVMSEDSEFFEHSGVNYNAVLESVLKNLQKGRYVQGGSTISQQVAKNLFLTNEKTLTRKLKEVIITKALEKNFSKNQILEVYLNMAEFGPDVFGVNAASWKFFNKGSSKINAAEGAFLAIMLPSPRRNFYSIFQNKNITAKRMRKIRRILQDMLQADFISEKQYYQYLKYRYFK